MRETRYSVENRAQVMDVPDYRAMQGKLYDVTVNKTVSDGGKLDVHLTTGSKPAIVPVATGSSGAYTYRLYEDDGSMDVNSDGTVIEPDAFNRVTSETHGTSWQQDPTINNYGTEVIELKASGSAGGPGSSNSSTPGAVEDGPRILKPNTDYIFELEDRTSDSDTDTLTLVANFWESDYNLG